MTAVKHTPEEHNDVWLSIIQAMLKVSVIDRMVNLKLTPFHGHLIVLTEGVRDAQSQTAVPGAIS